MRLLVASGFVVSLAAMASAQSDNRYGAAGDLPPGLADLEAAFATSPPPTTAPPNPSRGRYGAQNAPTLPRSTPEVARNELRALDPATTPQAPSTRGAASTSVTPVTPISPTRTLPQRARTQPPRPQQSRVQPTPAPPSSRFQRSGGVILPEAGSAPPAATRSSVADQASENAQRIISQMLQPPRGSELRGTPVTIADVTRGAGSRGDQSHRVDAYWDLCASVADYYLGLLEADNLSRLQQRVPAMSQSLRVAEQSLRNRLDTSLKAATAGQRRLASMMGMRDSLPLPGDGPVCHRYVTEFDQIFGRRSTTWGEVAEARLLHELLPLRHAELIRAAQAVERNEAFVQQVADRSRGSDGTAMVRALELLALNRRAFVQIAKDYNRRIARYAELATPGRVDTNLLVAMLVGSSDKVAVSSVTSLR